MPNQPAELKLREHPPAKEASPRASSLPSAKWSLTSKCPDRSLMASCSAPGKLPIQAKRNLGETTGSHRKLVESKGMGDPVTERFLEEDKGLTRLPTLTRISCFSLDHALRYVETYFELLFACHF